MSHSEYSSSSFGSSAPPSSSGSSYLHGGSSRTFRAAPPPPPPPQSLPIYHKPLPSPHIQSISVQQKAATLRPGASLITPTTTASTGDDASPYHQPGPFSRSRSTGNLAGQQPHQQQPQPAVNQYQSRLARVQAPRTLGPQQANGQLNPVPVPATSQLSDLDIDKVEMFYRSHRTHLFVGRCLVNLYFTETDLVDGGRVSKPRIQDWKLTLTGVPVLIFNKGETKSRDKRQIQIVLAERGTGFPLWRDLIDNLSSYSADQSSFHTMYCSADHRKMAGLSFDCPAASVEFYRQIEPIISNPLNIGMAGPKRSKVSRLFARARSKSVGRLAPSKDAKESAEYQNPKNLKLADISSPCLFQHVTSVNLYNRDELPSILTSFVSRQSQQYPQYPPTDSSRGSNPTAEHSLPPLYSTPEPVDSASSTSAASSIASNRTPGMSGSYGDLHPSQYSSHHILHRNQHSPTSGSSSNESNLSY